MILKTKFKGLKIIKNKIFFDQRGYFKEILRENKIKSKFPFHVMSFSKKNVIRGLHLQRNNTQGKFVTVLRGKILDVAVDLRKNSKTFGKYFKIIISDNSDFSIFIPKGFAHGFLCLSNKCAIYYKCTNYRHIKSEKTLLWNDKKLKINWGIKKPIMSKKDKNGTSFTEIVKSI